MDNNLLYQRIIVEDPLDAVPIASATKRDIIDTYSLKNRSEEEMVLVQQDTTEFKLTLHNRECHLLSRLHTILALPEPSRLSRGCVILLVGGLIDVKKMQQTLRNVAELPAAAVASTTPDHLNHAENQPIDLEPSVSNLQELLADFTVGSDDA